MYLTLVLLLLTAGVIYGQSVNLSRLNMSSLDLSKVNLSNVGVYFQGPAEFYVDNIGYGNRYYAAILSYDGHGHFTVKVPQTATTAGKPVSADLSRVAAQLTSNGIELSNVVFDGNSYSGTITFSNPNRDFVVTSVSNQGPVSTTSPLVAQVSTLQQQVSNLKSQVQQKSRQINSLQSQLSTAKISSVPSASAVSSAPPSYVTAASRLQTSLVWGFNRGSAALGSWAHTSSGISQTNARELYAKYVIQARQNAGELFYSFTGSGSGTGWSGFGLHFLASDSTVATGYGFGSSYLVWVTRQPSFYQTGQVYVQLYKSSSDNHMVQLSAKAIRSSITSPINVSIYVNRANQMIDVMTNGSLAFSYHDPDLLQSGNSVALRALGQASFSRLLVKSP
jgi:hypothetical protein